MQPFPQKKPAYPTSPEQWFLHVGARSTNSAQSNMDYYEECHYVSPMLRNYQNTGNVWTHYIAQASLDEIEMKWLMKTLGLDSAL